MIRRIAAVGILSLASLAFAARFAPPAETSQDLDDILAAIEVEVEIPEATRPSFNTLPPATTTTLPPLPPGVQKFESGFVRLGGRGVLQLEITLELGVLTDIEMTRVPTLSERAKEINLETHPILTAEAIEIQGYRVHVVSGATETTYAWARALRDALEQADFCVDPKCDLPLR